MPSFSKRARTKRSSPPFAQAGSFGCGSGTWSGSGWKDQCGSYFAPCSIQRRSTSFSASLSVRCDEGGGITCSGSFDRIRCQATDFAGSPGTMALPEASFSGP